ncbi:cupin domain-containing protein [Szabonella alba]|uniref:Cupin domain-containing protein n=1 Tax=Szabonella alba TaxID=2804194 RepID=A0A8K0VFY9_9RHOB|nr:cupin domain-containing protein [Szabonella alba]MBL4918325.1 cupin domain-containing protein [Szabonella alba]
MIVDRSSTEHYLWGQDCDGWLLLPGDDLLVIEERMPPGTAETRHFHNRARQFFYVLSGTLTMELDGKVYQVSARRGIAVPPGQPHQARNDTAEDVFFLVISSPTSRGDRQPVPQGLQVNAP